MCLQSGCIVFHSPLIVHSRKEQDLDNNPFYGTNHLVTATFVQAQNQGTKFVKTDLTLK